MITLCHNASTAITISSRPTHLQKRGSDKFIERADVANWVRHIHWLPVKATCLACPLGHPVHVGSIGYLDTEMSERLQQSQLPAVVLVERYEDEHERRMKLFVVG